MQKHIIITTIISSLALASCVLESPESPDDLVYMKQRRATLFPEIYNYTYDCIRCFNLPQIEPKPQYHRQKLAYNTSPKKSVRYRKLSNMPRPYNKPDFFE
jgi:hypothetical protein